MTKFCAGVVLVCCVAGCRPGAVELSPRESVAEIPAVESEAIVAKPAGMTLYDQFAELQNVAESRPEWSLAPSPVMPVLYRKALPNDDLALAFAVDFTSPFCQTTQGLVKPLAEMVTRAEESGETSSAVQGWDATVVVNRLFEQPEMSMVVVELAMPEAE